MAASKLELLIAQLAHEIATGFQRLRLCFFEVQISNKARDNNAQTKRLKRKCKIQDVGLNRNC
jgi:hypothetical protein